MAAPAAIGDLLTDVDTPAIILDSDALDFNIRKMVELVRENSAPGQDIKIRPHVKAHKCPQLALRQIELSDNFTIGVCCQKVIEAEVMVGQFTSLLLAVLSILV